MGSPTDLYDAAAELLAAASAAVALTDEGPIPAWATYVSEGLPAFDCIPQLTVHAGGPAEAPTAPTSPSLQPGHRTIVGFLNLVALTITVIRCASVQDEAGEPPNVAAHEAASRAVMGDVWTIWNHLNTLKRAGTLFAPLQREMFLSPAVSLKVQGGACGYELGVQVQLDGWSTDA